MPIVASDIQWRYSVNTGSAGNSVAQSDPNAAVGKYMSTTSWAGGSLNDLFDDISGAENLASASDYRCIFVYNSHPSLALLSSKVWVPSQVAGGAVVTIGLDPTGKVTNNQSAVQAVTVIDQTVAPAGVTFSSAGTLGTALTIGDLQPGQCIAVWIKRQAQNTGTLNNDGVTLRVTGETMP